MLPYDAAMSSLIRIALLATAVALALLFLYSPRQWRQLGRRIKIVGFAYVAAILIGAVLRLLGLYGV